MRRCATSRIRSDADDGDLGARLARLKMMEVLANMSNTNKANEGMINSQLSFTQFDPDDTPFSTREWIEDINRLISETGMSNIVVVLKASHALKWGAAKFHPNLKPLAKKLVNIF